MRTRAADIDLILIGFGNVARRFVALLADERTALARRHGLTTRVVGIVTRRHGHAFAAGGLPLHGPAQAALRVPQGGPALRRRGGRDVSSTLEFLRDALTKSRAAARQGRLVVIETTTLDIARGEPATSHIRAALAGGAHVVTANKGPVAFAYRALARAAARADRHFLFEGAVMDGVPVFNLVRDTLPGLTVKGFRGVVNSTTNFILTAMEQGQPFAAALAEMQARGIAEADASLDVDGWDAAAKTAALANVLLAAGITPHAVDRQGLTPDAGRRAVEARAAGHRLKLVARARREGRHVTARVRLEELPGDDLLAGLEGQQNAIILETDLLDEIAVVQRGGSLTQTAYALLSDLVTIARARRQSLRSTPGRRSL
jgi:homoserine dehydrogenase